MFTLGVYKNANAGGTIALNLAYTYTGVADNYLLTLKLYWDCSPGIPPAPINAKICYSSISCGFSDTIILTMAGLNLVQHCPYHPPSSSPCIGSFTNGMQEWIYEGVVSLPFNCNDWKCSYGSPYNPPFDPLEAFYTEATLDNINFSNNNSSVQTHVACILFCGGNPSQLDISAIDIDGDSLSYSLQTFLFDTSQLCPSIPFPKLYVLPWSPYYFVTSSTPIVLDSTTGIITFTPSQFMIGHVSLEIKEFRNGLIVGTSLLQQTVNVIGGCILGVSENSKTESQSFIIPNIFNHEATIMIAEELKIKEARLKIFDPLGKLISEKTLYDYQTTFFKEKLNSGIYFYQLVNDAEIIGSSKMIIY